MYKNTVDQQYNGHCVICYVCYVSLNRLAGGMYIGFGRRGLSCGEMSGDLRQRLLTSVYSVEH